MTVRPLGLLTSQMPKTFVSLIRIMCSPLMYKEHGADLYLAREGMKLYDQCVFPDMFELASRCVHPMPMSITNIIAHTLTTPMSSPVTNIFSLTYFTAAIASLKSAGRENHLTHGLPYLS